ncbi:Hypothetical predicted protein [Mytilus galloprovincialis]|uniref:Uncharacterized protein n=1 Tax=Mytilus galloprovincialis TaxID=29158 RepID=A0A8B6HC25_MYTGA|nr:Hypothetical predicted protein [Mytilus galloprovincialis]
MVLKDNYVYFASSDLAKGGIFSIERNGRKLAENVTKLVSNGSDLKQAFGIAVYHDGLVLTDIQDKKIKLLSGMHRSNTLTDYAGVGKTGHRDGVEAEFQQPAGLCTEQGTIFVTDIAAGSVRMVISSSPLVKFLEFLNMFHKAIGVTLPNVSNEDSFEDRIAVLQKQKVYEFLIQCNERIRDFTGINKTLQGPEGACSAQSVSDLKMMIDSLQQVLDLVRKVKPTFEERLNIKSCLTLVVENLFAEMRQGNDMPLVLQFSQRFHSCTRELLKRVTKSSFVYFTGENSYYHRTDNSYVSFQEIPRMDLPVKKKLSADQMSKLRCWRSEFGQSVRQNTVRGLTTKDKPGTLPLTCYEKGDTAVKEIDVGNLDNCLQKDTRKI